jgi:hypothetical protein
MIRFAVAILTVGLLVSTAFAQAPELIFVEQIVVRPEKSESYDTNIRVLFDEMHKVRYPFAFHGYVTSEYHYYFLAPIGGMENLPRLYQSFGELAGKMGKKWDSLHKRFEDTIEYEKFFLMYARPDLSYNPKHPRLKYNQLNYHRVIRFNVKYGKETEFERLRGEMKKLLFKADVHDFLTIYQGGLGTEGPVYYLIWSGLDAEYLEAMLKGLPGKIGKKQAEDLGRKLKATCRSIEEKRMWSLPHLSFVPAERQ